ncbi:hypothetical protein MTO96_038293 [Rhipicephalus appendiculatus]
MYSTEFSANLESPLYVVRDSGSACDDGELSGATQVQVAWWRNTCLRSTGNYKNVATGQSKTPSGRKDLQNVPYGRKEKTFAVSIPLLVRTLDPTRTIRDLDPERVSRELQTEAGVAPESYYYMRFTRGGFLALGATTAQAAVWSQRVRCLDGTPGEVGVPFWHGHNAAKIRGVPAWISDADIRESLYKSTGVVSVRWLVACSALLADGRRRDKPQTHVVLVFRPELSCVPGGVTLCGVVYAVEQYFLPSTQHMRCQRFGHEGAKCSARVGYSKVYAGPHHHQRDDIRGRRLNCANCEGLHVATFAMCPLNKALQRHRHHEAKPVGVACEGHCALMTVLFIYYVQFMDYFSRRARMSPS